MDVLLVEPMPLCGLSNRYLRTVFPATPPTLYPLSYSILPDLIFPVLAIFGGVFPLARLTPPTIPILPISRKGPGHCVSA